MGPVERAAETADSKDNGYRESRLLATGLDGRSKVASTFAWLIAGERQRDGFLKRGEIIRVYRDPAIANLVR